MLFFFTIQFAISRRLAHPLCANPRRSTAGTITRAGNRVQLVAAAVGAALVGGPLLLFLYGAQFSPSVPIFEVIVWDLPLLMFSSFCGNMTTVVGQERAAARIYGINAVANIVLNAIFIPHYGAMGAAVVTVVTDLVGTIQFYVLLRHKLKLPDIRPLLARVAVATAIMGAAVFLAHSLPLAAVIALGVAIYLVLAVALKIVGEPERAVAARLWRKVAGRLAAAQGK
jgi:O-antigen/teichoic acid export membrane protein